MNSVQLAPKTISSLEIAELSGKPHSDVMKAIRKMEVSWTKLAQGKFSLGSYLDKNNQPRPMYQLSKTESLYIATKFNDTVRARLVIRWEQLEQEKKSLSIYDTDPIMNMRRSQIDMEIKLREVEENQRLLEAKITNRPDYFSISGYASYLGVSVPLTIANKLGRQASAICKARSILIDHLRDPRFGKVGSYPTVVLREVFSSNLLS